MIEFLEAAIRIATPLMFAALGGILSERAGVFAVGLEGMMLMGAFGGAIGAWATGSAFVGVGLAIPAPSGLSRETTSHGRHVHALTKARFVHPERLLEPPEERLAGGPGEGATAGIMVSHILVDPVHQFAHAAERPTADCLLGDKREPALDLVEPARISGGVMHVIARTVSEPGFYPRMFVGGVVVGD